MSCWNYRKYRVETKKFLNKVLRTDETNIQLIGSAHEWTFYHGLQELASETDSLIFTDAMIHGDSSRINSEVNWNILFANLQGNASKLIGRNLSVQEDNDPKHTANRLHQRAEVKVCRLDKYITRP